MVPSEVKRTLFRRPTIPSGAKQHLLHPDDVWDSALRGDEDLLMHGNGRTWALPVRSWIADADPVDHAVAALCNGPTLDVGCGPGRFTAALAQAGLPCLGLDSSAVAVAQTRARGVLALHRSVWRRLPGEGHWRTTVLLDGNVGIGGNPGALLRRMHAVTEKGGSCIVETTTEGDCWTGPVHLTDLRGMTSRTFPWSRLDADALTVLAATTGWSVVSRWTTGDRPFLRLQKQ